jgi:hypothetical protein
MAKHTIRRGDDRLLYIGDVMLMTVSDAGEPIIPKEVGEDLYSALYDYVQCEPTEDGDEFVLDGKVIGRRESVHFIPNK